MLFAPAIVTAQDADVDDSDLPQRIASIIALGPGVHELQTDGKRIKKETLESKK